MEVMEDGKHHGSKLLFLIVFLRVVFPNIHVPKYHQAYLVSSSHPFLGHTIIKERINKIHLNKFAFRKILKTSNEESFDKIKIIFKH